jgi:lipopolysaccharide transport system permease protein
VETPALLAVLTALAAGLWLMELNARYRDVQYVVPLLVQPWLFITPLMYPSSQVPANFSLSVVLNPLAGVAELFRWALADAAPRPGLPTLLSAVATILLLIGGLFYFRSAERTFADLI